MNTIEGHYRDRIMWLLTYVDSVTAIYARMFYKTWFYFSKGDFATQGKEAYMQHNAEVRKLVPTKNLLACNVGQGWGPLCSFLELPIPDLPFPTGNDQGAFWQFSRSWNRARAIAAAKKASTWIAFLLVLLVALYYGRYSGPKLIGAFRT